MVKLEKDPLLMSTNYFDDVITMSFTKPTYEITHDSHIELLELAVECLAFHGAKINVNKCDFARASILFLEWYVCNDFLCTDPRRVEKIQTFEFPQNK